MGVEVLIDLEKVEDLVGVVMVDGLLQEEREIVH